MKIRSFLLVYFVLLALAISALLAGRTHVYAQGSVPIGGTVPDTVTPTATEIGGSIPNTPTPTATQESQPIPATATATATQIGGSIPGTPTATATGTTTPAVATQTATPTTVASATATATVVPSVTPSVTPSATPSPTQTATANPILSMSLQPNTSATLTATSSNNSRITIQVPTGAVNQATLLVYNPVNTVNTLPSGFRLSGLAFTLTAIQNNIQIENFTFIQPITLIIDYKDADIAGLDESLLDLFYYSQISGKWLKDGITILNRDPANNRIVIQITHLTQFALLEVKTTTDSEEEAEPNMTLKVMLPLVRR